MALKKPASKEKLKSIEVEEVVDCGSLGIRQITTKKGEKVYTTSSLNKILRLLGELGFKTVP